MSNVFGILNTGKVALLSQQAAIQVTGQNIANVNTEGYSRQEVIFEAATPINSIPGMLGTGVKITEIQRVFDQFIFSQINSETYTMGSFEAQKEVLDQIEIVFNETTGGGLSNTLSEFFAAFQDLSINPQGLAQREAVLGKTAIVISRIQQLGSDLKQKRTDVDNNISATIDDLNLITSQIAQLNKQIHESEAGDLVNANDLRDQREKKIKELADLIDIQTLEENNNQITITTNQGQQLVLGQTAFSLSTQIDGDNFGLNNVMLDDGQGNLTNITSNISGGRLNGMVEVRDSFISERIKELDLFTAGLIREVNELHIAGYGTDGSTGNNFFDSLSITARANTSNSGSATISGSVYAPSTASIDEYQIEITGSNTFSLTNLTTGAASGTFTFSSGSAVNLGNGLSTTISGSAQTNDIFTFSLSEDASISININSTISSNRDKIAAGTSQLAGDGSNALSIAGIQNDLLFDSQTIASASGSYTFEDFYSSIVSNIGLKAEEMNTSVSHQESVINQLVNRREEVVGVSLDEEMINLIKFQQAFAAAAKIITSVDEMLTTVRNLVR
ncbi:MAG TPA: flagellar hook-associated protein FlgK [Nitrospinota bacterium]|jgi:flagellar hook-associated protein 1 FlgK|nr:flagellar hook-associated protein FlgK [Nitrospinota bacterium]